MSAMEKMLEGILKNMLPPEVLAAITPENIEKITNNAKELKDTLVEGLKAIQVEQSQQRAMLEDLLNDLDGNSGKPTGTRAGTGTGKRDSK